jgi:DNA-binding CsgD family transcriptional regulator
LKVRRELTRLHIITMRASHLAKLTEREREREAMALTVQGYSNKKVASCLSINHRTVLSSYTHN